MKQTFSVTITETLKRTVTVKADNSTEVIQNVTNDYYNSNYILSADDFDGVSFTTE